MNLADGYGFRLGVLAVERTVFVRFHVSCAVAGAAPHFQQTWLDRRRRFLLYHRFRLQIHIGQSIQA
jgi:hypothetical protein